MKSCRIVLALLSCIFVAQVSHAQEKRQFFVSSSLSDKEKADIYYRAATQEKSPQESAVYYQQALDLYAGYVNGLPPQGQNDGLMCHLRMASCARRLGKHDLQQQYLNRVITEGNRTLPHDGEAYLTLMLQVADQCLDANDDIQAYRILNTIRNGCKKYPSLEADWLSCMSKVDLRAGRHRPCITARKKVISLTREAFTKDPSSLNRKRYITALTDMADASMPGLSALYYMVAYEEYVANVYEEFYKKSEVSRALYWGSVSPFFDKIIDNADIIPDCAYDAALITKGILLNTSIDFQDYVKNSGDAVAIAYQEERNRLVNQDAPAIQVDSLDNLIVERLAIQGIAYKEKGVVHWQDVRDVLGPDDLAIEFYYLPDTTQRRYGALLLKHGWKEPINVSVESADAPWTPQILRYFPVTEEGRVFFSPAGQMNLSAIEYYDCPVRPSSGDCMADVYKMYRLSSTRELVRNKPKDSSGGSDGAGVFGGIRYSAHEEDVMAANASSKQSSRGIDTEYESILENKIRDPEGEDDSSIIDNPPPLPFTSRESHALDTLLSGHKVPVHLFTGIFASEEALERNTEGVNILHFATHGFYVSADAIKEGKNAYYTQLFSARPDFLLDPLYRSGLHMAGSSPAWDEGIVPDSNVSDGILMAREISLLDLSGVDLVVLSACDSGLGDLSADGVYGLPRAFKKAGVGTILMSLKPVIDDASTQFLMYCFYQNMLLGKDKQTAFMEALTAFRRVPGWAHPDAWRSFILLDAVPAD